ELFVRADFITVHTPLTPETRGLIGAATLARMKRGVRLVNCARGGIVDEEALAAAIRSGHVAGAALDVFAQEPPPSGHPLLALEQVIATPHLGASTGEAQVNVAVAIAQQVADFLCRGIIQNAVNVPSLSPEILRVLRPYLLLAEKLGALHAQLSSEPPLEMIVQASGEVAERELRSLAAAVLRGLLGQLLEPGVVGRVGTLLGERGINIAGIELGRERVGGMALSLIHVDEPVPADVLDALRTLPQIVSAQQLRL